MLVKGSFMLLNSHSSCRSFHSDVPHTKRTALRCIEFLQLTLFFYLIQEAEVRVVGL